ncbi:hypothetical protein PSPO01_12833 [Paraphaeosphaeria sporulosa]
METNFATTLKKRAVSFEKPGVGVRSHLEALLPGSDWNCLNISLFKFRIYRFRPLPQLHELQLMETLPGQV